MKALIIILFFLTSIELFSSEEVQGHLISYNLTKTIHIDEDEILIVGKEYTARIYAFLIYNYQTNEFKEFSINESNNIRDVEKNSTHYCVLTDAFLYLYEDGKIPPRMSILNEVQARKILYFDDDVIIVINAIGEIFEIELENFTSNTISQFYLEENFQKVSYRNIDYYISGKSLYSFNKNQGFNKEVDLTVELKGNIRLYNEDMFCIGDDENFIKLDKDWKYIAIEKIQFDYKYFDENYFYTYHHADSLRRQAHIFRRTLNEDYEFLDSTKFYHRFNVTAINELCIINNFFLLIGDYKLVVKYEFDSEEFEILSALKMMFTGQSWIMLNPSDNLNIITRSEGFVFISTNRGVTWRYSEPDSKMSEYAHNLVIKNPFYVNILPNGYLYVALDMLNIEDDVQVYKNPKESLEYEWSNIIKKIYRNADLKMKSLYNDSNYFYSVGQQSLRNENNKRIRDRWAIAKLSLTNPEEYSEQIEIELDTTVKEFNGHIAFDGSYISIFSWRHNNLNLIRINKENLHYEIIPGDEIYKTKSNERLDRFQNYIVLGDFIYFTMVIYNEESEKYYIKFYKMDKNGLIEFISDLNIDRYYQVNLFTLDNKNLYLWKFEDPNKVFISFNEGKDFEVFIDKLPSRLPGGYFGPRFVSDSEFIYLIEGRGILKLYPNDTKTISSVIENEVERPPTFYTYRPYPNPANNMVTLPFDFMSSLNLANMEIKLIDVSGRDVSQFADFNIRALNHYKAELEIKLDNIQRGIYFIQMTLNGTNKTSSFIKLN